MIQLKRILQETYLNLGISSFNQNFLLSILFLIQLRFINTSTALLIYIFTIISEQLLSVQKIKPLKPINQINKNQYNIYMTQVNLSV